MISLYIENNRVYATNLGLVVRDKVVGQIFQEYIKGLNTTF